MVEYAFENIERKVHALISSGGSVKDPDSACEEICFECERVKRVFVNELFRSKGKERLRRFFSVHQCGLVDMLDLLEKGRHTSAAEGTLKVISEHMADVLMFIRQSISEHFNVNVRLPKYLAEQYRRDEHRIIKDITDRFSGEGEKIKALAELVVEDIRSIPEQRRITFGMWDYISVLNQRLMSVCTSPDPVLLRQDIFKVLMQTNFNSARFFTYFTEHVDEVALRCETTSEKVVQLTYFVKICMQGCCTPGLSLDPSLPPITMQLISWITSEIDYLKTKQQFAIGSSLKEDGYRIDFKINLDLSVASLACLIRTFSEAGVIQNSNTSELIRFLSRFVRTKKSEAISYESFRIKYYNVESGTKDAVKKMLQSMLQHMNRDQ